MKYGLRAKTIEEIQTCLATNPAIESAILYGSRAKGNFRHGSDIDLTLTGKNLTLTDVFRLEEQLDDLLLPYQFDISIYSQIDNPDLLEHIGRVGVLLFEKNTPLVLPA